MNGERPVETGQDRRSEHIEVFRRGGDVLPARGRFCTASVTRASSGSGFKSHRGVRLNLCVEDLQDGIAEDGYESVARETGLLVLGLLDAVRMEEGKAPSDGKVR